MPTTTNRGYSVPSTGTQSGVWGSDDLNPNFTSIDKNLGAVASVALSGSTYSLSSSEYVCGTIKFTGALSQNITVTFPTVAGWWTIINNCTGSFYIRLSCSSGGLKICPPPGEAIDVGFDGTDAFYRNLPHLVGGYWDYAGSSVPVWVSGCSVPPYLACDGSSFSAVTYPFLNTIMGGTTLPDTRGRARFNLNGGQSRITTAGSSIDGDTRFSAGGAQNVTLSTSQIPTGLFTLNNGNHNHGLKFNGPPASVGAGAFAYAFGGSTPVFSNSASSSIGVTADTTITLTDNAGGTAHTNMPPTYIGGITMIRAA